MTAAGEVDREEGVPADERRRVDLVASEPGGEQRAGEDAERREHLEDPRRGRGRRAGDERDAFGEERERRPVDGRRVAPVRARLVEGGIVRELARRVHVGIAVVHRCDPAVLPVRPRVRRDEQRAGERDQLDHDGGGEDGAKRRRRPAEQHEPGQVRGEGEDEQREEDRAERAAVRAAAVGRHERCSLDPRTGDASGDERADRTRGEQARAGQGSSGSVVAGGCAAVRQSRRRRARPAAHRAQSRSCSVGRRSSRVVVVAGGV